jgi:hypothetical protein
MAGEAATDGEADGGPNWRVPALRCGLEIALFDLIVAYIYLHVGSGLLKGLLLVVGFVGTAGILLWYVNRLSLAWVRYAQTLQRQRRRKRQRKHRQRRRERQQRDEG